MAQRLVINGEDAFQVDAPHFCIGAAEAAYTLNYSADGVTFTPWYAETAAGVNQPVVGAARGMFYKLVGNTGDVVITY